MFHIHETVQMIINYFFKSYYMDKTCRPKIQTNGSMDLGKKKKNRSKRVIVIVDYIEDTLYLIISEIDKFTF